MRLQFGRLGALARIVVSVIGLSMAMGGSLAIIAPAEAAIANLDEPCGGPDKITCNSALYCQLPSGQCTTPDAAGTCVKAPDFCMRVSRPVCGCNGKTYANDCDARHAKVAIDTTGACKKVPGADGTTASKPKAAAKKKKKAANTGQ